MAEFCKTIGRSLKGLLQTFWRTIGGERCREWNMKSAITSITFLKMRKTWWTPPRTWWWGRDSTERYLSTMTSGRSISSMSMETTRNIQRTRLKLRDKREKKTTQAPLTKPMETTLISWKDCQHRSLSKCKTKKEKMSKSSWRHKKSLINNSARIFSNGNPMRRQLWPIKSLRKRWLS